MNKFILFSRLYHPSSIGSKKGNIKSTCILYISKIYIRLRFELIALPHLAQNTQYIDISVS